MMEKKITRKRKRVQTDTEATTSKKITTKSKSNQAKVSAKKAPTKRSSQKQESASLADSVVKKASSKRYFNFSLIFFLLRKYLSFDRSQPFISITAILAFLGVGIGVMVLIVAMAIMNGLSEEFEKKLFVMNYPINLFAASSSGISEDVLQDLEKALPDLSFSPYLQMQAIAKDKNDVSAGMIFGVDFKREVKINPVLQKALQNENLQALNEEKFPIVIGEGLAQNFILDRGDKLSLFFTKLEPTGLVMSPLLKRFDVVSVFSSGLRAYDIGYLYTNLDSLFVLKGVDPALAVKKNYDGIHIYSPKPMEDIERVRSAIRKINHPAVGLEGWWQQNGNFFAAMALEKRALFIVLMLIILMASLNIISSLLMVIMNRRKEIALLLSMGLSMREVKRLFFLLGNTIGFSGIVLGLVLSAIVMYILHTFPIISLPEDVYGITKLPLSLALSDLCFTIIGAVIIVCISSYYPSLRASKIDALQVLRNE